MVMHVFKYRLKKLLRTKEMIFWTLAFPIILAFFFNLAFSNLDSSENFEPIPIALVTHTTSQPSFSKEVLRQVSSGDDPLFILVEASHEKAKSLLKNGEITGYIIEKEQLSLHVKGSGFSQNIVRLFLDNLNQTAASIHIIAQENPESIDLVIKSLSDNKQYIAEVQSNGAPLSMMLNYFYSLIGMACMYGAFFGSDEVADIQANLSQKAARINCAPVHKMKAFLASSLASYSVLVVNMFILLLFIRFVLGIDFKGRTLYVIATTLVGSLVGLTFGSFISSLVKKGDNIRVSIIVGVTMVGAFLSGMMLAQMKYIVKANAPILSYLNPVNVITDAFYSLYFFDSLNRYYTNMMILLGMSIVFSLGTYFILRRRKYASL